MVTMPSEAASDGRLVEDLLHAGMDIMRINCAHDDPDAWRKMAANLRHAQRVVGERLLDLELVVAVPAAVLVEGHRVAPV